MTSTGQIKFRGNTFDGDALFDAAPRLGIGSFGEVFLVDFPGIGQAVVKIAMPDEESALVLADELHVMKILGCEHPGVICYEGYFSWRRSMGLVSKYIPKSVDGYRWSTCLKVVDEQAKGIINIPFFIKIVEALEFIHSKGVIHRDIDPSNIIVSAPTSSRAGPGGDFPGNPVLIDFGLAKTRDEMPQGWAGKASYMDPNLAYEYTPTTGVKYNFDEWVKADIYSLGCTFYYCMAGRTMWRDNPEIGMTNSRTLNLLYERVIQARKKLTLPDGPIWDLIYAMTQINPITRPSLQEVRRRLEVMR